MLFKFPYKRKKLDLKLSLLLDLQFLILQGEYWGHLKKQSHKKNPIFSSLNEDPSLIWVLLGSRQTVMVNSPCYNFVMKEECHTLFLW